MIEAKFPNGFGEFGDDANSLESFDFLIGLVAEAADDLLKRHSAQLGLSSEAYLDYYFNHWVTPTTGVLVHTSYDSSGS